MTNDSIKILAIESSCDETAAAIIECTESGPVVLSNIVSSQADLHAKTGGVVPEVASREHMKVIVPVIAEALMLGKKNQKSRDNNQKYNNETISQYNNSISFLKDEIDYIAVTVGPGLIGSLLAGFNAAKTIAYSQDLPVIPINHIEGHIYSAFAEQENSEFSIQHSVFKFPLIALTVSGGHTSMTLMKDHGVYETIGQTIDDAVGEAYDKVAQLLGLGYPGGPVVSKFAEQFRNKLSDLSIEQFGNLKINNKIKQLQNEPIALVLPRPMPEGYNFSFSGLKTAVLREVRDRLSKQRILNDNDKEEICFAFEGAVADVLCTKLGKAIVEFKPEVVAFAGGVSANNYLRERLEETAQENSIKLLVPPRPLCGDNAAMIGLAAYYHVLRVDTKKWSEIKVDSNIEL